MKRTVLTLVLILAAYHLFAVTYYVSTTGSDARTKSEAQNINTPWRTIQKAANEVTAGDRILIRGGTYYETIYLPSTCTGNAYGYITFEAYPGETVIIDQNNNGYVWIGIFVANNNDYLTFKRLNLRNGYFFGWLFENNCDHINIEDCSTLNTGASGIYVNNGKYIYIYRNVIDGACKSTNRSTNSQECISLFNVTNFEVKYNEVKNAGGTTGGEGIDAKGNSAYGVISDNYVYNLAKNRGGIYVDSWDGYAHDIVIERNRVSNTMHGIMIAGEQGGTTSNITIQNNICWKNQENGILLHYYGNGILQNIKIVNNTVYLNGVNTKKYSGGIWQQNTNPSTRDIIIRNNIVSSNLKFQIRNDLANSSIIDYNLIHLFRNGTNETKGTNYVEGDPQFVNPNYNDFHLKSTSPAINTGTSNQAPSTDFDIVSRPQGTGFDIGAFEYIGTKAAETVSIEDSESAKNNISIYPNPASEKVFIDLDAIADDNIMIEIYDVYGKCSYQEVSNGRNHIEIRLDNLRKGLYFIKVHYNNKSSTISKLLVM